jgi:YHS domain-containing protein
MKILTLGAAVALIVGGLVGCGSSEDHRDAREAGGAPTTRGGERDDSTRLQTDPVCGMNVNPRTAIKESYNGQTYYFDTKDCAKKFRDNPQAYMPGAEGRREVR